MREEEEEEGRWADVWELLAGGARERERGKNREKGKILGNNG